MILNYSVSSLVRRLTNSVHLLILKSDPPFLQMLEGGSKMSYYFFCIICFYTQALQVHIQDVPFGCNLTRYSFSSTDKVER